MYISAIDSTPYHFGQATIHVGQSVTLSLAIKYSSGATSDVSTDSSTQFLTNPVRGNFTAQNVWAPTSAEINHSVTIYGIFVSPTGQRITGTVSVIVRS